MSNYPSESDEQRVIVQWCDAFKARYPELKLLYHVPNGGKRTAREAARFKAEGVKPGVPDLVLPVARNGYHGLYIELKRRKGGTVSDNQKEWIKALTEQGYRAVVCKGADEAISEITAYMTSSEMDLLARRGVEYLKSLRGENI